MKSHKMKSWVLLNALFMMLGVEAIAQTNIKPNVIVVLADDIGTGDISHYRRLHCNNIILETPNIDNLATQGMFFTNAHSPAALCATSRYSIMTGNYCYRSELPWGVWSGVTKSVIKENQMTLGRLMKQANYNTAFFGKWHIGTAFGGTDNPEEIFVTNKREKSNPRLPIDIRRILYGPTQLGFDYNFVLPAGIQNVPYAIYENDQWFKLRKNSTIKVIDKAYMDSLKTDHFNKPGYGDSYWNPSEIGPLLANKAVDYIAENAHKKDPFFMYYCSQAVHTPHAPPIEINGVKIKGTTPSRHMDMIKELDQQVGMLVAELKKQGVYENTVIIFTSDNGGLLVDKNTAKSGHKVSDIYRGSKNLPYEGGHRVPFIAVWPGEINENINSDKPIIGLDILATLAGITKQELSEKVAQDSYNLLPVLKEKKSAKTHDFMFIQGGANKEFVINDQGWKLIIQVNKKTLDFENSTPIALFNLNDNITEDESKNYIDHPKYQKKAQELFKKYKETIASKVYLGKHKL